MQYKEAKTFKGFEAWFHSLQMTAKMYIYTFMIVLLIHLLIPAVYMILFQTKLLSTVIQVFLGFHVQLWPKALEVLFRKGLWVFILSTPVWLLFPALLARFKSKSKEIMQDKHLRGQEIVSEGELRNMVISENRGEISTAPIYLGSIPVPRRFETRHFLVLGKPGVGKTTLLYDVIEKLRDRGEKAVIYDYKGDYVSMFFDETKDLLFNPLDSRTLKWNVFKELETVYDVFSVTHSLIEETLREQRFWIEGARDIFSSILFYLYVTGKRTNKDIWDAVSQTEEETYKIMTQAIQLGLDECRRAAGYLAGHEKGSKVAPDTMATMRQYTNAFQFIKDHEGDFSIRKWIEHGSGFLFVVNYEEMESTLQPLLSLLIDLACKKTLSLPDSHDRRIFFILDEFVTLQRMPALVRLLTGGRSKGASVWLALQDVNQLSRLYSQETMGTIVNACNTLVAFGLGDAYSQRYISEVLGQKEILETDESLSMGPADYRDGLSITRRRKIESLILPSELAKLPDFHFYLKMLHYPVAIAKAKRKQRAPKAESYVVDEKFMLEQRARFISQQPEEQKDKLE